jgi:anti-sigma factor RsiW
MNCKSVRKFLYAFADGQLSVRANCEVLDHLKMCPECSGIAEEHQSLRHTIARHLHSIPVPGGLEGAVRSQLHHREAPLRLRAWGLTLKITAMAACLVAAVLVAKQYLPSKSGGQDRAPGGQQTALTADRVVSNNPTLNRIAAAHQACFEHRQNHQAVDVPRNLIEAGSAMIAHYGNRLAVLAPDLTRLGYRFESADYCGILDGEESRGAHLLFASADGARSLSLFSIPRRDCFDDRGSSKAPRGEEPRFYEVSGSDGVNLSIGVWHKDATTYVMCSEVPTKRLARIVDAARTGQVDLK